MIVLAYRSGRDGAAAAAVVVILICIAIAPAEANAAAWGVAGACRRLRRSVRGVNSEPASNAGEQREIADAAHGRWTRIAARA
jgi:hypothetical protein